MSAFVVSKTDIDILVTAFARLRPHGRRLLNLNAFGRALWRENVASVAYRYGMPDRHFEEHARYLREIETYRFKPTIVRPEAVAKVAACYDYQTCEHDGYEASEARQIIQAIAAAFPETVPGYDAMPWGISCPEDLAKARPAKRLSAVWP
jgi:hypothetical protein